MRRDPAICWASDSVVRVELGQEISPAVRQRVYAACRALKDAGLPGLLDVAPAYTTILLTFDPVKADDLAVIPMVTGLLAATGGGEPSAGRLVDIPTCYEGEFSPDLEQVASMRGLTAERIVALHSGAEYHVDFLGFSPGFAYLSGLPPELETPRLERPRARVPAGSVAIGGAQTGVYPHATPGGWRIIGRTPLRVFDETRDPPALLAMGDRVRFVPISAERFGELEGRG
jgi:KipI family sensor histidine kinase inhibitor